MARPMRNHDGDVYDPFLGSGTTMVAAEQLGRKCFGMELDPNYCQVIIDRMRKLVPGIPVTKNGVLLFEKNLTNGSNGEAKGESDPAKARGGEKPKGKAARNAERKNGHK